MTKTKCQGLNYRTKEDFILKTSISGFLITPFSTTNNVVQKQVRLSIRSPNFHPHNLYDTCNTPTRLRFEKLPLCVILLQQVLADVGKGAGEGDGVEGGGPACQNCRPPTLDCHLGADEALGCRPDEMGWDQGIKGWDQTQN